MGGKEKSIIDSKVSRLSNWKRELVLPEAGRTLQGTSLCICLRGGRKSTEGQLRIYIFLI